MGELMKIGTDVVEHDRFIRSLNRGGEKLTNRIFRVEELELYPSELDLALIFSAKESISKALGTGFDSMLSWQDINITVLDYGLEAELFGRAHELAASGSLFLAASRGQERTFTWALLTETE
jgi:holo-[acyl-carrier-protein] synthase